MRVAPLPCIMLLCRPLSSSESSPFARHSSNIHLSTRHPAISAALKIHLAMSSRIGPKLRTRELPSVNRLIPHRRCSTMTPCWMKRASRRHSQSFSLPSSKTGAYTSHYHHQQILALYPIVDADRSLLRLLSARCFLLRSYSKGHA